jgi:hypothetical protein
MLRWELKSMSSLRAVRYRKLALASKDRSDADLLLKIADECDRGTLCSAEWLSARPYFEDEASSKAKARIEWKFSND